MLNSKLTVRKIDYRGCHIAITMLSLDTFVYELPEGVRVIESGNGASILFIDSEGNNVVINRQSVIYKELIHRVMNGKVLEDGSYQYQSLH